uniref:Uncharacterized protein LOC114333706 n=1 Tax=Diabrotica virgifera virgifera TaxID=50390 RepID=A0A6P7FSQ7_DIAVI
MVRRSRIKGRQRVGKGIVNRLINKLPFEAHLPGYRFCGPGTRLQERLDRGDRGVNALDSACKEHDIAYSQHKNLSERHEADKILENKAWERVKSKDARLGEKVAAWFVTTVMKGKRKLGMGLSKKSKKGGALKKKKRTIRVPKKGGFLPFLLPLLGALGAVGGGAASIASAVNKAKADRQQLAEQQRHNLAMEQNSKTGKGFYLRPYKGYGIKNVKINVKINVKK